MTAAEEFAAHMIRRIQEDGRVGWYIGPASRSLELLVAAGAQIAGQTTEEFAAKLTPRILTERPRCASCSALSESWKAPTVVACVECGLPTDTALGTTHRINGGGPICATCSGAA